MGTSFFHPGLFFVAGALLVCLAPGRWGRWLPPLAAIAALVAVATAQAGMHGALSYLGLEAITGRVDRLSVIFAYIFAIQAFIGFIYSLNVEQRGHHAAALFYVAGAMGCVFAGDYLTLFVCWEVMSIASTFLIWLRGNAKSTAAGYRYLLFHALGGMVLLAGLLLRQQALGTFEFTPIDPFAAAYYDYLILAGFAVNAAVVPLHAWLSDAYPEATVAGAVFLSAFTTKTAVYVLARGFVGFEVLAIMGVVMALYGVFYATIENNARRILAYHIVSQVGYMVAGIGIGTALTVNGAVSHAYAHILYKGLLFMGAGCLLHAAGTAKLSELGGLARRLPLVLVLYMVAAVSISGMPLFSGFVTKTMTITGAAEAHRTWLALGLEVAAVGTFLSVGLKLPYFAFFSKPDRATMHLERIPLNMYIAMVLSALLCLVIGIYPDALYRLLPFVQGVEAYTPFADRAGGSVFHPYEVWRVLQACLLLGFTGLGFYFMRKVLAPKAGRNLDFDFVYRLVGRGVFYLISIPLAFLDSLWSQVYAKVGLRIMAFVAFLTTVFDTKGIDGVLDNGAWGVRGVGRVLALIQTGGLQWYIGGAVAVGLVVFAAVWMLVGI